ncbi:hypothetical protein TNCV_4178801, partial [Trichonephila clavipes]
HPIEVNASDWFVELRSMHLIGSPCFITPMQARSNRWSGYRTTLRAIDAET